MNEVEIRELLKLVRGIEHYLERALKTIENTEAIKRQGITVIEGEHPMKDEEIWTVNDQDLKDMEFPL